MRPLSLVDLEEIRAAADRIAGLVVRTPLLPCLWSPDLWLKPENLQPIGAFKVRGAANAMALLPPEVRAVGVVTHSSGNHGQALAYVARRFGVPAVVVMPDVAARVKIDAVAALGAEVILVPPADRIARVQWLAAVRGLTIVPPFDHRDVIAGQGTIGLEVVADTMAGGAESSGPGLAAVLVPIGGGGLASGVATAVKALAPGVCVVGVEPELAADAVDSFRTGEVVTWPPELTYRTAADGLRTHLSDLTLAHLRDRLDGILTVSEEEILHTVGVLARSARLVAEPSGAVATAAWLHRRDELAGRFGIESGPVVAIVTGGNLDPALLSRLVT